MEIAFVIKYVDLGHAQQTVQNIILYYKLYCLPNKFKNRRV